MILNTFKIEFNFCSTYDEEVSFAPLLPNEAIVKNRGLTEQNISMMHIFYKETYFRSENKEEIIAFTDFLCEQFNQLVQMNDTY